jgi:hypothetical protein
MIYMLLQLLTLGVVVEGVEVLYLFGAQDLGELELGPIFSAIPASFVLAGLLHSGA